MTKHNNNMGEQDQRVVRPGLKMPLLVGDQEPAEAPLHQSGLTNLRQIKKLVKIHKMFLAKLALAALTTTLLYSFFAVPEYKSTVTISITPNLSYRSVAEVFGAPREEDTATFKINLLMAYFQTPEVAKNVLQKVQKSRYGTLVMLSRRGFRRILTNLGVVKPEKLTDALKLRSEVEIAADVMSYLHVKADYNNNSAVVESTTANPKLSAFLANAAADALLEVNKGVALKKVHELKGFLTSQAQEMGDRLKTLERRMSDLQSKSRVISVDEAERYVYNNLNQAGQQAVQASVVLNSNERMMKSIRAEMKRLKENLADPNVARSDLYLAGLQHRLSMLQYQKDIADRELNPNSKAAAKELGQEIETIASDYRQALDGRERQQESGFLSPLEYYEHLEVSIAELKKDHAKFKVMEDNFNKAVDAHKKEFPKLASTVQKINALKRNILLTTELYLTLKKRLQETEIQEAGAINDLTIVSPAQVPYTFHTTPMLFKLLFATLLSFFFGLFIILSRETAQPMVTERYDLEKEGVVVLGEMPFIDNADPDKPVVVVDQMPLSYEREALRSIRLRLDSFVNAYFDGADKAKVVLVTSPRHSEGKTFTAVNLAATMAKGRHDTVLIDLDLASPSVADYFSRAVRGMGAFVSSGEAVRDKSIKEIEKMIEQLVSNVAPHLDVIKGTSGIQSPGDFLDSDLIPNLIQILRKKYDYIFIDAPPVLGVSESVMISSVADLVLLVAEHRRTRIEELVLATEAINDIYSRPLVGVINGVHREFTHETSVRRYQHKFA